MKRHVVIIGAGVAGLSAAFAARERGIDVTVVSAGVGASALGGGAVDDLPWEAWYSATRTLGEPLKTRAVAEDVRAFSDALGLWDLPATDAHAPVVATAAGRLRPARGRDRGLLDLGSLRQTTVLVPRVPRANWDADTLCATFESEWFARQAELRFVPVDAPILRFIEEARIADADLAMRHDEPARLAWLAERLRELVASTHVSTSVSAVLLGSWLGVLQERATELSARLGKHVGEVLVGVGSSAGLRFEIGSKRLWDRLSVKFVADQVHALRRAGEKIEVLLTNDALVADTLVIATGGVCAGGIVYTPPEHQAGEHMPPQIKPAFSFGIQTNDVGFGAKDAEGAQPQMHKLEIFLGWGPDRIDAGSSIFGPALDTTAWPSGVRASKLESVGIEAVDGKVCPGVYAAGDIVAGKRRTVLDAVASGLRVGRLV